MEISKMVTLSSAHLTPNTRAILNRNGDTDELGLTVYVKGCPAADFGWYIYLPDRRDLEEVLNQDQEIAADLVEVIRRAIASVPNLNVLCFDCDGPIEEELPSYDCCEWCGASPYNYESCRAVDIGGKQSVHIYGECNDCRLHTLSYLTALKAVLADNTKAEELLQLYGEIYQSNLDGADPSYLESYKAFAPTALTKEQQTIPRKAISAIEGLVSELCDDVGDEVEIQNIVRNCGASDSMMDLLFQNWRRNECDSKRKYSMERVSAEEEALLFSNEHMDAVLGTVGHLRMDTGIDGTQLWTSWWPHNGGQLTTAAFQNELDQLINALRSSGGPLSSLEAMKKFCSHYEGSEVASAMCRCYGFKVETDHYRFMFRLTPYKDYSYVYCYDKMASAECK